MKRVIKSKSTTRSLFLSVVLGFVGLIMIASPAHSAGLGGMLKKINDAAENINETVTETTESITSPITDTADTINQ